MIAYNPKDWFTFIFRIHKADTIRRLFFMIVCIATYTAVIAWLELTYWNIGQKSGLRNFSILHTTLGFVLSMLLVFRTNTAYDRWWEGRKLWGSLVNNSRNLAIKLHSLLKDEKDRSFFHRLIPAYAYALRSHLLKESTRLELDDAETANLIDFKKHVPNQIATLLFKKLTTLQENGKLTTEQLLLLNNEISGFADICGACERIKNTPIPFSYSLFVKKFIFLYVMTLPFGFVFSLGYFSCIVVAFIFYVLASLEMIAEEIEDPFGTDSNDLPTLKIADGIKKTVQELI
jgi:ion channel-forming bestrophin family protein